MHFILCEEISLNVNVLSSSTPAPTRHVAIRSLSIENFGWFDSNAKWLYKEKISPTLERRSLFLKLLKQTSAWSGFTLFISFAIGSRIWFCRKWEGSILNEETPSSLMYVKHEEEAELHFHIKWWGQKVLQLVSNSLITGLKGQDMEMGQLSSVNKNGEYAICKHSTLGMRYRDCYTCFASHCLNEAVFWFWVKI